MKAIEIVSKDYPILPKEERVKTAIEIMYKKHKDRIIVSRNKDILYGIVTEWDIMYKLSLTSQEMYSPYNLPLSSIATYPVDTINPDTDLKAVINMFLTRGYSSLPIVEDGKIIGLITKKEIIKKFLPKFKESSVMIEEIMDRPRGKVELFQSLIQAETKMKASGYNSLIVHDRNRFIGIITALNIARLVFTIKKVYPSPKWEHYLSNLLVADATLRDVDTLKMSDPIYAAADIIANKNQKIIPIVENDECVGIITRRHLLRYLIDKRLI